ncbi:MAG: hypothetical protein II794_03520 [Oscillospiraceae bacterium]|nr:hypothetical protein [Oscillospiraceae bacterium]
MAERKTHTVVSAGKTEAGQQILQANKAGSATGYRVGAIVLWVLAIVAELVAVFYLFGKFEMTFMPGLWFLIGLIVLDLVFVIIGSQLWKKANHIKPASKKNAFLFWLWNNMGVVVACFAFFPLIIIMLTNKDLDKKTKTIATIAAVVALLIGGAASIDYNPISQEEQMAAGQAITSNVYWTQFGKVYHTHEDCAHLNHTDTLYTESVAEAIAAGKTRLCKTCANRDSIDTTGILTEENAD